MKILITSLILLSFNLFSQNQAIFRIDSIPTQGILLDKGWKWHAGDNPDFAKADFDDSGWESIDPTKDIMDLPQVSKKGHIFWLRLNLIVDSSLNDQLVMMIKQSGASEIYLNGKIIHSFGVVSKNILEIKAYTPFYKPVSLPIYSDSPQILAIRYALQPNIMYSSNYGYINNCILIEVNSIENGQEKFYNYTRLGFKIFFHIGVFSTLYLLFFTFYLFYSTQIINLYFSFYALSQIVFEGFFFYRTSQSHVGWLVGFGSISIFLQIFGYLLLLWAIYHLLSQKIGVFYWILLLLGVLSIVMDTFVYGWGYLVNIVLFINLFIVDTFRISLKAVKNGKKGAWIMAIGGIFSLVSWFIAVLQIFTGWGLIHFIFITNIPLDFISIAILCNPIAVAIYLGYDFALTNRSLKQKLVEVEILSTEKQQILSSQNETLEKQVNERTFALNNSLDKLKSTQAQLIQSEKLASLGELTAGIAHEIQNPLNFVNNFSEVSSELIGEMNQELDKGDINEAKAISIDLKQNLEKITEHGKRASSIVKGMLEHSRTSSGEKKLTDIKSLADEYLRLAYHGLRAKDKDFNSDFKTDFDPNLPKIAVIPQDIGRVLLNLINNAFYAVRNIEKPLVTLVTEKSDNQIIIKVKDNGVGMSNEVQSKIFQPFFTTKPTGQGTGLGLSLAYDIVTKGHGGTLEVESKEGEGAEFIVKLPIV